MGLLKKIKKDPVESIIIILYTMIFIYVNFLKGTPIDFLRFITDDICIEIIRLIIDIPYCVIIIPIIFSALNTNTIKKHYYHCFHLLFCFLPMVLIGRYIISKNNNRICELFIASLITLFIASLIMAYCIYKKLKQAQEVDIQFLKYSRLLAFTISTIFFSFASLFYKELKMVHFLFFSSPLLMLQVVYEKIDLQRKRINCVPIKNELKTPDTGEKEQISERQSNATASGTICVNLEVKI